MQGRSAATTGPGLEIGNGLASLSQKTLGVWCETGIASK